MGKETEGTSNGGGRYLTIGMKCGTLTKLFPPPNLTLDLDSVGVVEVLAALTGLGQPVRPDTDAWDTYRRLCAACLPELLSATELLVVPLEFRHQTSRPDLTTG